MGFLEVDLVAPLTPLQREPGQPPGEEQPWGSHLAAGGDDNIQVWSLGVVVGLFGAWPDTENGKPPNTAPCPGLRAVPVRRGRMHHL